MVKFKINPLHLAISFLGVAILLFANYYVREEVIFSAGYSLSKDIAFNFASKEKEAILKFSFKKIPEEDIMVSIELNGKVVEEFQPRAKNQVIPLRELKENNILKIESSEKIEISKIEILQRGVLHKLFKTILSFSGVFLIFLPFLLSKYKEFKDIDDAEEKFPDFLYDIVDGVRSGMPLTQAIKISRNNDYGALSSFVRKLAAKIDWGMNFDKALTYFADSIGSKDIKRSTRTIVQSYYSGGEIADVLEAVAQNMREIRKLKKERQLELYGELITAYVVFFVFLASIIMFSKFILPLLFVSANIQPITGGEESLRFILLSFDRIFTYIIIIQAIFFGLIIGKLIYGSYKAGVKHSIFMTAVGYLAASIFL